MILDGRRVAQKVLGEVQAGVERLRAEVGVTPMLAVVLVGDFAPSKIYVANKKKAAEAVGVATRDYVYPAGLTQRELLTLLRTLNAEDDVHGILLQLPLVEGCDEDEAIATIAPEKDVDGLHPTNLGRLLAGAPTVVPCTAAGCLEILDHYGAKLEGAEAVVIGRSRLVGKPLAQLLLARHATVTTCHTRTRDLAAHARRADVPGAEARAEPALEPMTGGRAVLTVSQLTEELRVLLEERFPAVWVEGEISNFRLYGSGHTYFTLKDADAQLRCVLFRTRAQRIRFQPADGLHVVAFGSVEVYARSEERRVGTECRTG